MVSQGVLCTKLGGYHHVFWCQQQSRDDKKGSMYNPTYFQYWKTVYIGRDKKYTSGQCFFFFFKFWKTSNCIKHFYIPKFEKKKIVFQKRSYFLGTPIIQ